MKNKRPLTKEQKQARMIQRIALGVVIAVFIIFGLLRAFDTPTAQPTSSVTTACGRTGEFATLTSGTPITSQGQVLAWLSFANGFVEISVNNGAPQPIHPSPMADGDEANFRFILEYDGQVFGEVTISGFACNGMFYYQLQDLQYFPSQQALEATDETRI